MFGMVPFDYNNHNWFDAFDNFEKNFFGNSNVDLPDFRTDIRAVDDKYILEAELPGFNKEDIQLDVKDGILTITAQHTENEDEKNDKGEYIRRERRYGSFRRSFDVSGIDENAITASYKDGVLEQKPTLVNLQCDIDHPTQCMADMLHIINTFGGVENLKGKKVAMTWAYSPSYGKPLSVPQGVIGLMTRFGMDVVLAHPEGYEVMPEVEEVAKKNAEKTGGSFTKTNSMAEAFKDADIVYPKSWAPFAAMEKRTNLYAEGDTDGIKALEKELLAQNAEHKDWCCTEELMATTKDGKALYLHCLPADINDVSCKDGEVEASVFDRYRTPLYKEASYKPYIIAAMILLAKQQCPQETLAKLAEKATERHMA